MSTPDNWQKSSYSGPGDGDSCVELAAGPTTLHLRESDAPDTVLTTGPAPVGHLLRAIRSGTVGAPRT
ncbi:DUF397 domain-containing protein [Streptomyces sp. NPDC058751]|uniref:DUF397 domain-containing protein n=1 Tax=Streptomyces sp. NPDC058751 TaxID=3346623 RepID=UPI0036C63D64